MYSDSPRNSNKQERPSSYFSKHQLEETKTQRRKNSDNEMVTLITKNMKRPEQYDNWV